MGNSLVNTLSNFLDLFNAHTHKPSALKGPKDMPQLIEHIVDVTDPKIRVISRYTQKLDQPLSHTWNYLNSMADMIPGGVTLNRVQFASNPILKLIFNSQSTVDQLLADVVNLADDNEDSNQSEHMYLLLCMEKHEHNFLGSELAGDIIKRDVLQTKVSFQNHKILSAGFNEEDAKLGFKHCALEGLLHKAHELLLQSSDELKPLVERKKQLHQQLRTTHGNGQQANGGSFTRNKALAGAHPELQDIERQIREFRIKSESPDEHLFKVIDVLKHPDRYLRMEKHSMRLNKMGIKLPGGHTEKEFTINYTEMEIVSSIKRIALIAECPTQDVFPQRVH
jgi:hypothetical protein